MFDIPLPLLIKLARFKGFLELYFYPLGYAVMMAHELGHLLAFLAVRSGGAWQIAFGARLEDNNPARVQWSFPVAMTGQCRFDGLPDFNIKSRKLIYIGGPLGSLACGILVQGFSALWGTFLPGWGIVCFCSVVITVISFLDFHVNLAPVTWSDGTKSDGLQIEEADQLARRLREQAAVA